MNILNIIDKKRYGNTLTKEEIYFAIDNFVSGEVKDYQMSSLLMAIAINGMNDEETIDLTRAVLLSGDSLSWDGIDGVITDKHSTGGVGDKTTLIMAPILASLGIKIAKMSGRGLGHTGGTIDKLEAINGFNVNLNEEDFISQINKIGLGIVSQTANLTPADKKMYALRDVTGTVSSIPLIAASIMSKKIASGAKFLVLDVKVGPGALLKTEKEAKELARLMKKIGEANLVDTTCVLTRMDRPLGFAIGNGLEVKEVIDFLNGKMHPDLKEVVYSLTTPLVMKVLNVDSKEAVLKIDKVLESGVALDKFKEFVAYQGGNIQKIAISPKVFELSATKSGYLNEINTLKLAELVRDLGAGRHFKDEEIDHGVGVYLNKKLGDFINENELLMSIYYNKNNALINDFKECFLVEDAKRDVHNIIV